MRAAQSQYREMRAVLPARLRNKALEPIQEAAGGDWRGCGVGGGEKGVPKGLAPSGGDTREFFGQGGLL